MARSLLLLRHAEAQPTRTGLADFDRTLTPRGRDQAREAARGIIAAGLHPDLLLASPAARTRETADIVVLALGLELGPGHGAGAIAIAIAGAGAGAGAGGTARMLLPPALYLADVPALLSALQGCDDAAQTLLLIAHNPGISALARELAAGSAGGSGDAALELGPGALCHLRVEVPSWRALEPATVRTIARL